ncbi:MAG: hypothetical protein WEA09_04245 [Gemmatimonadota bacterium]
MMRERPGRIRRLTGPSRGTWAKVWWALPLTPLLLGACGECTFIDNCVDPARVQATGVLVNDQTRQPVAGALVTFTYRGGPGIGPVTSPPVLQGVSDSLGSYRLEAESEKAGRLVGRLSITPPSDRFQTPRAIEGVTLEISRLRRDLVLDTLVLVVDARPLIRAAGVVVDFRSGEPIQGVQVVYRIQSGPRPVEGGDSLVAVTDSTGRFVLTALMDVWGSTVGRLDFLLPPPSPTRSFFPVIFNTSGRIDWEEGVDTVEMTQPGFLRAQGRLVRTGTGAPLAGVTVRFEPRAGPPLEPAQPAAVSDADGRFLLEAHGGDTGPVVGTLVIEAPPPVGRVEISEVEIPAGTDPTRVHPLGDLSVPPPGGGE